MKKKYPRGAVTYRSDTFEAMVVAIFIDSGDSIKETKKCIEKIFRPELDEHKKKLHNPQ